MNFPMHNQDTFWDFYWETRLLPMQNLGKRTAILSASRLIRRLAQNTHHPLRLLELGCGEGQVIGTLLDAHSQLCDVARSVGVDYKPASLANCQRDYPRMRCIQGDFTDPALLASLGQFDVVMLVNALHEVFSDCYSSALGEIDVPMGKQAVKQAFAQAVGCVRPRGWVVLFDGLDVPGDSNQSITIRFRSEQARRDFKLFAAQYQPFRITYQSTPNPLVVILSQRDFTRYITKSIFLGKQLWQSEQLESYQYFTEDEFRAMFDEQQAGISEYRPLTVNAEKWQRVVEILTPGVAFPHEHILMVAQK